MGVWGGDVCRASSGLYIWDFGPGEGGFNLWNLVTGNCSSMRGQIPIVCSKQLPSTHSYPNILPSIIDITGSDYIG